jgi:hypothetical protein
LPGGLPGGINTLKRTMASSAHAGRDDIGVLRLHLAFGQDLVCLAI